ncbi:hypothetical protein [Hymenobacter sp.]|uniref:hypothetical protein n=1 Tax=Hymenobacter sp. TaxID=1898978 RepID=UPI00286A6A41|nr:hypothetical protein [Hymenobacter sp.]
MALPKKGLRKITVDNFRYAWSATGNDGWISLSIAPLDNVGQLLTTVFDYHSKIVGELRTPTGKHLGYATKQQLLITPFIIRQIIQIALKKAGNQPRSPPFNLPGVENMIDLRLVDEH